MNRFMLKSKIHRATVTASDLNYIGSLTVDADLLDAADIIEHERVHVLNVNNGARLETYVVRGQPGSGEVKVNGAAARMVNIGDIVLILSYGAYDQADLAEHSPRIVHVSATNRQVAINSDATTLLNQT